MRSHEQEYHARFGWYLDKTHVGSTAAAVYLFRRFVESGLLPSARGYENEGLYEKADLDDLYERTFQAFLHDGL